MIKIVAVGRLKEKYWLDASSEYLKRLSRYTKIEIVEILEEKISDESLSYQEIAKKAEGERILKKVTNNEYVILLDLKGEMMDSISLSKYLDKQMISSPNITFIIGGSYGVSEEVKKRANYLLAYSKLTFPHQLARIMLLEQIYRSFKIINNEKYHK